jgi:hypothetical protein
MIAFLIGFGFGAGYVVANCIVTLLVLWLLSRNREKFK